MIGTAVDLLANNWALALGLSGVGLLAFWTFDERENQGSTIEGVGNRADDFFGNLLGGFGSLVMVVLTILTTIGANLVEVTDVIVEVASGGPVLLVTQLAGIALGALGLSGVVSIEAATWIVGGLLLTVVALVVRRRRMMA